MGLWCFLAGFATALVAVAAALLFYYRHLKRKRQGIRGYLDLIPDLTAEQKARVEDIRSTFLPGVEKIRQDLCRLRVDLARALFSEPADRGKIDEVAREIMESQSELERRVIDHIIEEKELLDRGQRMKFYEIILEQFAQGGLGVHDPRRGKKS